MPKKPKKGDNSIAKGKTSAPEPGRRPRKKFSIETLPLPEYLKDYKGPVPSKAFGPEDMVWIGDAGLLSPEAILEEKGYEPQGPLRMILEAIVSAHPDVDKRKPRTRADAAEFALVGKKRGRGNVELEDEQLLREIAKRYFKAWVEHRSVEIEVEPIAKAVLNDFGLAPRAEEKLDSEARRLQRKFKKERDRLLARVTTDIRMEPPDFYIRMQRIFSDLEALGINLDKAILERCIS